MSVALLSTAVVLILPFLLSYFIFHGCYVSDLVDTPQYVSKLLNSERASRSLAKTGLFDLSDVMFPHEDIAIFTKSADN